VLSVSAGEREPIAIDRDPKLFKLVLATSISNTPKEKDQVTNLLIQRHSLRLTSVARL
jgi:hypothetical protein